MVISKTNLTVRCPKSVIPKNKVLLASSETTASIIIGPQTFPHVVEGYLISFLTFCFFTLLQMQSLFVLLVVLFCIGEVFPRHVLEEINDPNLQSDQHDGIRKHTSDQNRHRRRRWQANYGAYDYPLPPQHYYPERRDYDRNQQDLLPQIVRLLEEISAYVKRPQPSPMPQPIYIPYPVPYPVRQIEFGCKENTTKQPTVHNRFPVMEDTNQNWGFVIDKDDDTDDLDGTRPISFDPIKPLRPMMRPQPNVEHGSVSDVSIRY